MTESLARQTAHKILIIDLDRCGQCQSCGVDCGYYYRRCTGDRGIVGLRERVTFAFICRQCAHASCVSACPFGAIERQADRVLKRFSLRCVSCQLCAHACPFGTIYTDMLPFYESLCDGCMSRAGPVPLCVSSCTARALEYRVVEAGDPDIHVLDEYLAARGHRWTRREASP
jgi:Fe-S-cluster-containing hydrogenase component 2